LGLLRAAILAALVGCTRAAPWPSATLDHGHLRATLYLPDADKGFYQGIRFDHAGVIGEVRAAGHRFYAPLHAAHDPTLHDGIAGPAEEFGMTDPPGFAEAAPGETFVKIGVGVLRRPDDAAYAFDRAYELVVPGTWDVRITADEARFEQVLHAERGWAYHYVKTVRLLPGEPALTIAHELENLGSKPIVTDVYNHNFTTVDGAPYGPAYTVALPFTTDPPRPIGEHAVLDGDRIVVRRPLGETALWSPILETGGPVAHHAATVRHDPTGASVRFQGDRPITKMVFWAVERAACPEPFVALDVPPGETRAWSTRFTFSGGR
jgi:hypothetical protein